MLEQTQGLHLHAKFHLNVFIVSASRGQKTQFCPNFDFLGAPVPTPFTDDSEIWCAIADLWYTLTCQISCILAPSGGENPNFCRFFGLRHLVVSPYGCSLRKLNTGAQLQTFPYPRTSKTFLYSNDFMAKSGAQSLTFKSVTNKQTDQKNSTFLATPAAGEIRVPPNLAR